MEQSASWQTGRWYSEMGQRVAAQVIDGTKVVFLDIDRGIDGILDRPYDDSRSLRSQVMEEYDWNRYTGAHRLRYTDEGRKTGVYQDLLFDAALVPKPKEPV